MLATMSAAEPAGQSQNLAALAGRVAELQKGIRDANARLDSDLSAVRTEAGRLAQRLDGLKGEVEERMRGAAKAADLAPLAAKLAALEQELQGFLRERGRSQRQRHARAADAGARQPQARHRPRRALCRGARARQESRRHAQL